MSHSERARSRAYLRHQRMRIRARRAYFISWRYSGAPTYAGRIRENWDWILRTAENPCLCRCKWCRNPRHVWGYQSPHEDMAVLREHEQLLEMGLDHLRKPSRSTPAMYLRKQMSGFARAINRELAESP